MTMSILEFSEQLQHRLKADLDELDRGADELARAGRMVTVAEEALRELKEFIRGYEFSGVAEEVQFFKEVKPVLLSHYYYYKKMFYLRLRDSFQSPERQEANYGRWLQRMQRFVARHREFYHYCITGATHLDEIYFRRGRNPGLPVDGDERVSTGYDRLLGRLLAHELLRARFQELQKSSLSGASSSALVWTGSKTDLIELIYALHFAEPFNNGSANIKLIASLFEQVFHVNLGDYYRTFQDIRIRKKSQTPFLDQLREKFIQRLRDMN